MKYKAIILESEAGWGSRVDETLEFDTEKERDDYVKDYNDKYNPSMNSGEPTPSWYMIAQAV